MRSENNLYLLFSALAILGFASCQKVINVNLQNVGVRFVIEGNVTDQAGPYYVSITKSVSFSQDNVYPAVSGATVVITDNTAGVTDTLKETSPGNYATQVLEGVPRHQYSLYVNSNGTVFKATSSIPGEVNLDSLYTQLSSFRGKSYQLVPVYNDPVEKGNYYRFVEIRNDTISGSIYIRSDQLVNGRTIKEPIGGGRLNQGDVVALYLECIDSAIYQYYYGLQQSENANSASPANPPCNISGGCLGYFSAHTMTSKSIVVP